MKIYMYIMLAIVLYGCAVKTTDTVTRYTAETHVIDVGKGDSLLIKIEIDTCLRRCDNIYISVLDKKDNYLYDVGAVGGAELPSAYDTNRVMKYQLDKDTIPELAVICGIYGSTYGAHYIFVTWSDGYMWYVEKTPFDRGEIEDIDNDGIYEIVNYPPNREKEVYSFSQGCFHRHEMENQK